MSEITDKLRDHIGSTRRGSRAMTMSNWVARELVVLVVLGQAYLARQGGLQASLAVLAAASLAAWVGGRPEPVMPDIPPTSSSPNGEQKCPWCGLHVPLLYIDEDLHVMRHYNRDNSECDGSFAAAQENEEP